jgi:hypothetical protein
MEFTDYEKSIVVEFVINDIKNMCDQYGADPTPYISEIKVLWQDVEIYPGSSFRQPTMCVPYLIPNDDDYNEGEWKDERTIFSYNQFKALVVQGNRNEKIEKILGK